MGLRNRLGVLIATAFLLVCTGAGAYVAANARRSVADEMRTTAALAMDLLEAELVRGGAAGDTLRTRRFLDRLAGMESLRSISIEVRAADGSGAIASLAARTTTPPAAPAWFVRMVSPADVTVRRALSGAGLPALEMELRGHAADEIAEAWREARGVLGVMVVFTALVMGLVQFRLGRDLAPIDAILRGLEGIERGDYGSRLPGFPASELRRISDKFNHMAGVLQESRAENRRLRQRSLEIQEQERRAVARELHDELGQSLTAIKALAVTAAAAHGLDARARQGMEEVARIADHTYGVARDLMQRLRPPVLDVLGLDAALDDLVDRWNAANGGQFCRLEKRGDLQRAGEAARIAAYRIIQEALTNVARHSGAEQAGVAVEALDDGALQLRIEDDGRGFAPGDGRPGMGLVGMRERVEALGGTFAIVTTPGRGVCLDISLPAQRETT